MELKDFFHRHNKVALGLSGGVDSSYLLYAGQKFGADITAYFVKTEFQPAFELADAERLAAQLNAKFAVVSLDVLSETEIAANPVDRCYFCKKRIFSVLRERARVDGISVLIDGGNASDNVGERPGMRALEELTVYSPLRACGITKAQVRTLAKAAGLFTWNKPAYACLATRLPVGIKIRAELLDKIEKSENALFAMGFLDFRVRVLDEHAAKLQFSKNQLKTVIDKRLELLQELAPYFAEIYLDLKNTRGECSGLEQPCLEK